MNRPEPRFDRDYAYGVQGELFVDDYIKAIAEKRLRREDKTKTRHDAAFYVETEQNPWSAGRWRPSGIYTSEADVWVFNVDNTGTLLVVRRDVVLRAVEKARELGVKLSETKGDNPTRGYTLPLAKIIEWGNP